MNNNTRYSISGRILGVAVSCAMVAGIFSRSASALAEKGATSSPSMSIAKFQILPGPDSPKDVPHQTWIAMEFENITCQETLLQVVADLNLEATWNLKGNLPAAAAKLLSMISAKRSENSDIVTLSVTAENAAEAAKIADACVTGYVERRVSMHSAACDKLNDQLQLAIDEQERRTEEKRIHTLMLIRELPTQGVQVEKYQSLLLETPASIQQLTVELTELQSQSSRLSKLKDQELDAALALLFPEHPAALRPFLLPEKLAQMTTRLETLKTLDQKHRMDSLQLTNRQSEFELAQRDYKLCSDHLFELRSVLQKQKQAARTPIPAVKFLQRAATTLVN